MAQTFGDHIEYDRGYIVISGLEMGCYVLKFLDDAVTDITLNVAEGRPLSVSNGRFIANEHEIVELSPAESLQIEAVSGTRDKGMEVELGGVTTETRVHLIATHLMPRFSISHFLDVVDPTNLKLDFMANTGSQYLPQRMIGEEYRYVLVFGSDKSIDIYSLSISLWKVP